MPLLSSYEDQEDLAINGHQEIEKFIRNNYRKFTITQLCDMLGITPGVIKDVLPPAMMARIGSRAAATVMFIRDSEHFEEDAKRCD